MASAAFTWPAALPQWPDAEGLAEQPGDPVLWSEMEEGPPGGRLRTSLPIDTVTAMYLFDMTERAAFRAFHEGDLRFGSFPFNWWHPYDGILVVALLPRKNIGWGTRGTLSTMTGQFLVVPAGAAIL